MTIPDPLRLYRLVHIDCLAMLLQRQALHAPNFAPKDGLTYKTIHDVAPGTPPSQDGALWSGWDGS